MSTTVVTVTSDIAASAGFAGSRDRFEKVLSWLDGAQAAALSHGELEDQLQVDARELFRQMLQEHLDLRACSEARITGVVDAAHQSRPCVETGHVRALGTVFGQVAVSRIAYRRRGLPNLHPADAALNLPT